MRPNAKDDLRIGVIAVVIIIAAAIASDFWMERVYGASLRLQARSALSAQGYRDAKVWRDYFNVCPRGDVGYRWQTAHEGGTVCVGTSPRVNLSEHF